MHFTIGSGNHGKHCSTQVSLLHSLHSDMNNSLQYIQLLHSINFYLLCTIYYL